MTTFLTHITVKCNETIGFMECFTCITDESQGQVVRLWIQITMVTASRLPKVKVWFLEFQYRIDRWLTFHAYNDAIDKLGIFHAWNGLVKQKLFWYHDFVFELKLHSICYQHIKLFSNFHLIFLTYISMSNVYCYSKFLPFLSAFLIIKENSYGW